MIKQLLTLLLFVVGVSGQNVGIGIASPASKLSINGNLSVGSTFSGTAAPTDGAIIEGYVGIGTTTPDHPLSVQKDVVGYHTAAFTNSAGYGVFVGSHSNNNTYGSVQAYGGGAPITLSLQTIGGNVGIGTTTPAAKLHVMGGWVVVGSGNEQLNLETQGTFHRIAFQELRFWDWSYGSDMVTFKDGFVGIRNTTPAVPLEINFNSGATFIRLNNGVTNPFDVVFGTSFGSLSNSDGIVYFEVNGSETYMFGGHISPDANNSRDCGNSTYAWRNVWAYNYNTPSDKRLKQNIRKIPYGLETIMAMNPVSYEYKNAPNDTRIGLIAQEVQKLVPEAVVEDKDILGIKYNDLIPVIIKALQEQQKQIEELKQENEKLRGLLESK